MRGLLGAAGGVQALLVQLLDSGAATIARGVTGHHPAALGNAMLHGVVDSAVAAGCLGRRSGNGCQEQGGNNNGEDTRHNGSFFSVGHAGLGGTEQLSYRLELLIQQCQTQEGHTHNGLCCPAATLPGLPVSKRPALPAEWPGR